jgi:DNA-binding LytR/AlgR family response regulator
MIKYEYTKTKTGEKMKIEIKRLSNFGEPKLTIECDEQDTSIDSLIESLKEPSVDFQAKKDEKNYLFAVKDIYYIESLEDQCFLYTKDQVYDCKYRLYEVENKSNSLIRVNKNVVLNYHKIKYFKSTVNGRLDATLINGDRVEISRTYVSAIKALLGGNSK